MSNFLTKDFFEELKTKLIEAGLSEQQARSFVLSYQEHSDHNPEPFEFFLNKQMPTDECFRTLEEAQKIFSAGTNKSEISEELSLISRYLVVPYSNVVVAKQAMSEVFPSNSAEIEDAYYQDPEWLFITADSVYAFAEYLKTRFSDTDLIWSIYRKAALLGLEKTKHRIDTVLERLGVEIGEKVIRNDIKGDAWLFYLWFTDPAGCIEYMLECGLSPEKVLYLLECEPQLLFEYKEDRKLKYHHDQKYIDFVIHKYAN